MTVATPGIRTGYGAVLFVVDGGEAEPGGASAGLPRGVPDILPRLRAGGIPVALVPGGGARPEGAGIEALFDLVAAPAASSGVPRSGLEADALIDASRRLGVAPTRAVVVADSAAGVQAGRAGNFGLVVGIDGASSRAGLEDAGAHLVLGTASELDLGAARTDPWLLVYEGFDPAHEGHREALTALGNGYLGSRGAHPERHDDGVHYPGTYVAGLFNRTVVEAHGRRVEEEHLVNLPNWLPFDLRIGDGPWWSSGEIPATGERRALDLRSGVLTRTVTLSGPHGPLTIVQRSFASMHDPHLLALETTLTAQGWSGRVRVRSGIDAGVRNANGGADADATNLAAPVFRHIDGVLLCEVETAQSGVRIALASRTRVTGADGEPGRRPVHDGFSAADEIDVDLAADRPVRVDKTVALVTSRDPAIASPAQGALDRLRWHGEDLAPLLLRHEDAWRRLWHLFEVSIEADTQSRLVLNLHLFHLVQAVSPHTALVDAGVPARGLNGEGYRGHIFWDELFVVPVIGRRMPEVAAALLDYRWHRLDAARAAAREAGLAGAMFPWQSGSDGREETPTELYNSRSQRWMPDNSRRQRHVGLAVAFNAWEHFQTTGDREWLANRGADLMVEVARLFASLAALDPADGRFHIDGVMGPDEFHDGYPGQPGSGVRDSAYTNVLAAWLFARLGDLQDELGGHAWETITDRLGVSLDEIRRWTELSRRLAVPFLPDGVISQFAGYEELAELDWDRYRRTYGNIGRLDLILEAEGDATNHYRLSKQADVLMLVYLLGVEGLIDQLSQLGYPATMDDLHRTLEFYSARTSHGSTLSRVVHASVWAAFDPSRSWELFREALVADLDDTQGGTTRQGVHLGAMAGTADIVVRSFAGLTLRAGELIFTPRLPPRLRSVSFTIHHRGHGITVWLTPQELRLVCAPSSAAPVVVDVHGTRMPLSGGTEQVFALDRRSSRKEAK
ncbi:MULTISPECIES: glycosyl hydrolase family 65 protein [Microbacterium]|uniref:Glycosyl hydrolase family 65 protein n=1 Tax=Microbacterium bandirmense TaxID=3122050 RepID=A0ABU8L988_9MICO|nr:glycosyl hydrolase family 65 protein [Microbacterium kunmingense]